MTRNQQPATNFLTRVKAAAGPIG